MIHAIVPLVLVARDGFITYRCLHCGRPVSPDRGAFRHYQRANWQPKPRKAA